MGRKIRKPASDRLKLATRTDLKRLGITVSNQTLLRWESRNQFPRRIRMGGHSVAWPLAEIEAWVIDRTNERDNAEYVQH